MLKKEGAFKVVSLFSGAGGLDIGFKKAGFDIIWANDYDKDACESYKLNIGPHIRCGDIFTLKNELKNLNLKIDLLIGGPPCQGFSVAGKMDPGDPRSKHVWTYLDILKTLSPRAFVMENVKALGKLEKWAPIKQQLLKEMRKLGYSVNYAIVNASEFNVPQARERVLFIGFKTKENIIPDLMKMLNPYRKKAQTVREALSVLDKAGTGNNISLCKAKITLTNHPILRKSPFAGMLFNGLGRPVKLEGYCSTLPASMGGNKTPIIDEEELYNHKTGWIQGYHSGIISKTITPKYGIAPSRLRRMTIEEAAAIQTFPSQYIFYGTQSSKFKQIGNAVPCNLAFQVAQMLRDYLNYEEIEKHIASINTESIFEEVSNADSFEPCRSREEATCCI